MSIVVNDNRIGGIDVVFEIFLLLFLPLLTSDYRSDCLIARLKIVVII